MTPRHTHTVQKCKDTLHDLLAVIPAEVISNLRQERDGKTWRNLTPPVKNMWLDIERTIIETNGTGYYKKETFYMGVLAGLAGSKQAAIHLAEPVLKEAHAYGIKCTSLMISYAKLQAVPEVLLRHLTTVVLCSSERHTLTTEECLNAIDALVSTGQYFPDLGAVSFLVLTAVRNVARGSDFVFLHKILCKVGCKMVSEEVAVKFLTNLKRKIEFIPVQNAAAVLVALTENWCGSQKTENFVKEVMATLLNKSPGIFTDVPNRFKQQFLSKTRTSLTETALLGIVRTINRGNVLEALKNSRQTVTTPRIVWEMLQIAEYNTSKGWSGLAETAKLMPVLQLGDVKPRVYTEFLLILEHFISGFKRVPSSSCALAIIENTPPQYFSDHPKVFHRLASSLFLHGNPPHIPEPLLVSMRGSCVLFPDLNEASLVRETMERPTLKSLALLVSVSEYYTRSPVEIIKTRVLNKKIPITGFNCKQLCGVIGVWMRQRPYVDLDPKLLEGLEIKVRFAANNETRGSDMFGISDFPEIFQKEAEEALPVRFKSLAVDIFVWVLTHRAVGVAMLREEFEMTLHAGDVMLQWTGVTCKVYRKIATILENLRFDCSSNRLGYLSVMARAFRKAGRSNTTVLNPIAEHLSLSERVPTLRAACVLGSLLPNDTFYTDLLLLRGASRLDFENYCSLAAADWSEVLPVFLDEYFDRARGEQHLGIPEVLFENLIGI